MKSGNPVTRSRSKVNWLGLALVAAISFPCQEPLAADRADGIRLGAAQHRMAARSRVLSSGLIAATDGACRRHGPLEPSIYLSDFDWGLSTAEFRTIGRDVYLGKKRLAHRFFASEEGLIVAPVGLNARDDVIVPPSLVFAVRQHLEIAFRLHIIDHLALSDLGHAHMYLAQTDYADLRTTSNSSAAIRLREILKKKILLLYHSAERLKMKNGRELSSDPYTQVRFLTRNFLGLPNGGIKLLYNINQSLNSNTVYQINGMLNTAVIIYISANRRGCFIARNTDGEIRFDLSFISPS